MRSRSKLKMLVAGALLAALILASAGCVRREPIAAPGTPPAPASRAPAAGERPAQPGAESLESGRAEVMAVEEYRGTQPELTVRLPVINPPAARPGGKVMLVLAFSWLAPDPASRLSLTENVALVRGGEVLAGLHKRTVDRPQGYHRLRLEITLPRDLEAGEYRLVATLEGGGLKRTVSGPFTVVR